MGSFAQITLGILLLGVAFLFGRHVHQQSIDESAESVAQLQNDVPPADEDISWQNRTGKSLFELDTNRTPGTNVRPLVPFGPAPGSTAPDADAPLAPPQIAANLFQQSPPSDNNGHGRIFQPLAPQDPESTREHASTIPSQDVPLIEPDFSEVVHGPLELKYLNRTDPPGQPPLVHRENRIEEGFGLLRLRTGSGSDQRPQAPEFTIYPDANNRAGENLDADEDLNANAGRQRTPGLRVPDLPANRLRNGAPVADISPVGEPLLPPDRPSARDAGIRTGDSSDRSWMDDFNEPFVATAPNRGSLRGLTPPGLQQNNRGQQNVNEEPVFVENLAINQPRRDLVTQPQASSLPGASDSTRLIPFGTDRDSGNRLRGVVSRRPAMTEEIPAARFVHYQTVRGDSLQSISREFFGSPDYYLDIYVANQNQLRNPADVPTGLRLRIPVYE